MNKNIIIGAVILIIVVVAGGFLLVKGNSNTQQSVSGANSTAQQATETMQPTSQASGAAQTTETEKTSAHAVSYTEDGFGPQTITIKKGETVTWTNNDSDDLWVASDPHPTHTDYPGFDELGTISKGQTYSFTFTKVGHWGYHNHVDASKKGTVIVTE